MGFIGCRLGGCVLLIGTICESRETERVAFLSIVLRCVYVERFVGWCLGYRRLNLPLTIFVIMNNL